MNVYEVLSNTIGRDTTYFWPTTKYANYIMSDFCIFFDFNSNRITFTRDGSERVFLEIRFLRKMFDFKHIMASHLEVNDSQLPLNTLAFLKQLTHFVESKK